MSMLPTKPGGQQGQAAPEAAGILQATKREVNAIISGKKAMRTWWAVDLKI